MDVECRKRKRRRQCSVAPELPMDLIMEIFSRLSVGHIMKFYDKFFNLEFRSMICGKNFAKLFDKHNRNRSSMLLFGQFYQGQRDCTLLQYDNVAPRELSISCTGLQRVDAGRKRCPGIVNACHGWLLIHLQHEDAITSSVLHSLQLVNPITGDKLVLPEPQRVEISESDSKSFFFGFGFSPKTCQYKVLRFSCEWNNKYRVVADILTLQSSESWRRIDIPNDAKSLGDPVVFDGFICWKEVRSDGRILRFDVDDETFRFLSINTPDLRPFSMNTLLGVLDQCLNVHENGICWEMRHEDEWTKFFGVELPHDAKMCVVIQVLDRKKILFNLSDRVRLALYDLTEKKWEEDVLNKQIEMKIKKKRLLVRQFVPSFMSLESLINGDRF